MLIIYWKFLSLDLNAEAFQNINQPSSSDLRATVTVQNNMQSWNAFQMQQCSILWEESAFNPDFNMTEPQNAAPSGRSES